MIAAQVSNHGRMFLAGAIEGLACESIANDTMRLPRSARTVAASEPRACATSSSPTDAIELRRSPLRKRARLYSAHPSRTAPHMSAITGSTKSRNECRPCSCAYKRS